VGSALSAALTLKSKVRTLKPATGNRVGRVRMGIHSRVFGTILWCKSGNRWAFRSWGGKVRRVGGADLAGFLDEFERGGIVNQPEL
jgi:hypothetical protein